MGEPRLQVETLWQQALACQQHGDAAAALALSQQVLTLAPAHVPALQLASRLAYQHGQPVQALALLRRALQHEGANPYLHADLGHVLAASGEHQLAQASYHAALGAAGQHAGKLARLGRHFLQLGCHAQALASYLGALDLNPDSPILLNDTGIVYLHLHRYHQALTCFERVLRHSPEHAVAHFNRGNALRSLDRQQEAVASYDQVLALMGEHAEVYNNRGNALRAQNLLQDAAASFARAITLRPDYADAHWNSALNRLLAGDFQQGWPQYEWRWAAEFRQQHRDFPVPLWLGQPSLQGRTILLHAEQGLGDTLQFCRYVAVVAALGADVVLEVQPALKHLLQDLPGARLVVARGEPLPPFDCHCPLLSLPLALRSHHTDIPDAPYLHIARPVTSASTRLNIGLVWRGSAAHANDRHRSMPLARMAELLSDVAVFHSLQQQVSVEEQAMLSTHHEVVRQHELASFEQTAELLAQLDLVISVDTAVAHLAGTMGKPVWILLPFHPDWRWQLHRHDSPWYASARLFRQPALHDWDSVIQQLKVELQALRIAA